MNAVHCCDGMWMTPCLSGDGRSAAGGCDVVASAIAAARCESVIGDVTRRAAANLDAASNASGDGAENIGSERSSARVSVALPCVASDDSVSAAIDPGGGAAKSDRRESASATTLLGPRTYSILKSKSDSLSSHRDCRADIDCCVMKYCSEL